METKKGIDTINMCFDNYYCITSVSVFRSFVEDLEKQGFKDVNVDLLVKINAKYGDSKIGTTKKITID
jgi:hypothetical protein